MGSKPALTPRVTSVLRSHTVRSLREASAFSTATLHEAEALAEEGINDILITSPIVGLPKCERLLHLLGRDIALTVVIDNPVQVPSPSVSHVLNILIDIDL